MGVSRSPVGDNRGSSYDRRARRAWLVSAAAGYGGDGVKVACWECGAMVTTKTLHVDRIVPGELGGTYQRANIRPHCPLCSHRQGARRTAEKRAATEPYPDDHCRECGCHFLASHADGCAIGEAETW